MDEFIVVWTCEHCGRAVDVASDRRIDRMRDAEIYARVERTQAEHSATYGCPAGLDIRHERLAETV